MMVIGGAFIYLGVETFGRPEVFTQLVCAGLLVLLVLLWKEPNIAGLILIVFASRVLDLAGFQLLDEPGIYTKIVAYPLFGYLLYLTRAIWLTHFMFFTLYVCMGAEIYWYSIGYQAPQILWYMFGVTLGSVYIFGIDCRLLVVSKIFPNQAKDMDVDWLLRKLGMIYISLNIIMILEYVFRHLDLTGSLYIYNSYRYVGHTLSVVTVWAIAHQTYLLKSKRLFKA